ncbi:hypothetical protein [Methylobacterium sp. AMS5]|uniref:hypothetical protein n=1 Tax=Methylobacterium sp. AMS5 TaxID=925818 RepID=UPI00074FA01F|nr:hypothetical protein [Methylobacterium sp. AMS5]AMB48354.1 hypothetical protein Y590_25635 [Methylobacterium sp. AMS5]
MTEIEEQAADEVLAILQKAATGEAHMLPGPTKLYAHFGEGSTKSGKTVPFNGGTDLLFKSARRGKRDPYILEFELMDSDEWPVIDIPLKNVDRFLPKLAVSLSQVCAKAGGFEDADTAGWQLSSYVDYLAVQTLDRLKREETEREAEALVEQSERYADNDAWGMF